MDATVTNKEEMKRRLEKMKMKYAKMQRKLTKSERRKNAKNHVRRVLAEQASAPSPNLHNTDSASYRLASCGAVDSQVKRNVIEVVRHGSKRDDMEQRPQQRSISFKLDERSDERVKSRLLNIGTERQEFQHITNHERCKYSMECAGMKSFQHGSDSHDSGSSEAIKVSRLSHNNKTQRRKKKTDNGVDHANEVSDITEITHGKDSPSGKVRLNPKCTVKIAPESEVKTTRMQQGGTKDKKSSNDVDNSTDRLSVRHLGICQKGHGPYADAMWDGICLHQAMTNNALVTYRSQTAVLWLHRDIWQARREWSTDEGVKITNVSVYQSVESYLSIIFSIKRGSENELCFVTYNFETDTEEVRIEKIPGKLGDAASIRVIQNRAAEGVVMEMAPSGYRQIHFFNTVDKLKLWQPLGLEGMEVSSFVSVDGAPNFYLSLSSGRLSLWTPVCDSYVLDVSLEDSAEKEVDQCLWSKAEEGLLFVITFQKPSNLALSVLNPVNKTVLQVNRFLSPCSYRSLRVLDTAICGRFLSVLFSNQKILVWDVCTGQPQAEIRSPDGQTQQITGSWKFLVLNGTNPHLYGICR